MIGIPGHAIEFGRHADDSMFAGNLRAPRLRHPIAPRSSKPGVDRQHVQNRVFSRFLMIFGEKDFVVPADEHQPVLTAALRQAGNEDLTTIVLPDWEHGQNGWEVERRQATDSPFDGYLLWEKASATLWQTQLDWVLARVRRSPACPLE